MTTITVQRRTKDELNKLKYLYGFKNIEDIIIKYVFEEPLAYKTKDNAVEGA